MPSTRKKKDTPEPVIMLSYKDLVRRIVGKPPQQVKKGDPEWEDGIKCIKAYHSQATVLSRADQEGMRYMIKRLEYVIPPAAEDEPIFHPLMLVYYMAMKTCAGPSWAIFIILKTLYGAALPEFYLAAIRRDFHTTELNDYTHEYFMIDGAEPAAPEEDHPMSVQLANAVSERQTAEGIGCGCTIGNLRQTIDKKLEAIQDALEKKIEKKFAAAREDLERKEKEKFEAQTNQLQTMMREAVKFHGEALTRLAELARQRPVAPQGADV
ncbi:hypothetical protein TsFJ059_008109 [Trichoderma semiorbis]|uniref:Uncharacterized protein n=1 Tax=Trichoderma semiorbis TaxID=1491008 RepID=A0A9P8KQP1_9HYPO|nr:hypothetical protein TsFJ059_008109 [Trichoderma semiorbis]